MIVAVGSVNRAKLKAVTEAFTRVWPEKVWQIEGVEVSSGVADQPMSDEESVKGATQRATQALTKLVEAEYGVGLEGGLQSIGEDWLECGWIVVCNRHNQVGIGASPKVLVPPKAMALIHQGIELGKVSDIIFGTQDSKQNQGYFGLVTNSAITRSSGYAQGVIMALAPFLHPALFTDS